MKKNYPEVTNYPGPSNKNLYDGIMMTMVVVTSKMMIFHIEGPFMMTFEYYHADLMISNMMMWISVSVSDTDYSTDQMTMVTLWSGWMGLFCISLCHPCTRQERGWRLFIMNLEAIKCCELFRNTFHWWQIASHEPDRRGAENSNRLTRWIPYDYLTRSDIIYDTITPHLTPCNCGKDHP